MYSECSDPGLVCRRCGIAIPTLRKWTTRYAAQGVEGLRNSSRPPQKSGGELIFGIPTIWNSPDSGSSSAESTIGASFSRRLLWVSCPNPSFKRMSCCRTMKSTRAVVLFPVRGRWISRMVQSNWWPRWMLRAPLYGRVINSVPMII